MTGAAKAAGVTRGRPVSPWLLVAVLLSIVLTAVAPARAERLAAHGLRMAGDASRARIVLQFDREPQFNWFLLDKPHRLVIDLPHTGFAIDPEATQARGIVKDVHYGDVSATSSRLIVSVDAPFEVEALDVLKNESSDGWRLVADLVVTSKARFIKALADQVLTTASTRTTPKSDRLGEVLAPAARRFIVVIDPGHGGIDAGAEGISGTKEKTVTLDFAHELRKRLEASGRYDIHLTRDGDTFLRLDERVRIARQHGADLFISIHADTIRHRSVHGATVYTVSDQASDAEAAALAARENLSDELVGLAIEDEGHQVADILMDLVRRETHSFSIRFARTLLGEMEGRIDLIKNPHRFAGFRVLKAPDVPSVLLELGYLSNPADEKRLLDSDWRAKAIDSVVSSIDVFAGARMGAGR